MQKGYQQMGKTKNFKTPDAWLKWAREPSERVLGAAYSDYEQFVRLSDQLPDFNSPEIRAAIRRVLLDGKF